MKLTAYPKREPNVKAWLYRLLMGAASLLDGIVETITLGFYGIGAILAVPTRLAKARIERPNATEIRDA